jgi:O-antigen ligase
MIEPVSGLASGTLWVLTIGFLLAGPVLAMAPLGMAPLLIGAGLFAVAAERLRNGRWPQPLSQYALVYLIFLAWCTLSLIWDLSIVNGARKLIDLGLVLAALLALQALTASANTAQRRRLALSLAIGMAIGLFLLGIETVFDFPLYRAVMGNSDPRLVDLVESKRSVDALPLLVWPAALAASRLTRTWIGIVVAALFAVACFKLTASSATLGMIASLIAIAISFLSSSAVRWMLMGATILAFLLVIPISILAYDHGGTTAPFLKHSAQHRIEIWHFAADKALERPILGYGFNSSRDVPNGDAVSAFLPPGKPIIPLHPHNGFLQIWLELGAPGVMIAMVLLVGGLKTIGRWSDQSARFALGGYAAALVIGGLAFGIWQTWWMATLAFSALAFTTLSHEPANA